MKERVKRFINKPRGDEKYETGGGEKRDEGEGKWRKTKMEEGEVK